MLTRLEYFRRQAGVGTNLRRKSESVDFPQFTDDHQRRIESNAVEIKQGFDLRKLLAQHFRPFIDHTDLATIVSETSQQFIAHLVVNASKLLLAEPRYATRTERQFVLASQLCRASNARNPILACD